MKIQIKLEFKAWSNIRKNNQFYLSLTVEVY